MAKPRGNATLNIFRVEPIIRTCTTGIPRRQLEAVRDKRNPVPETSPTRVGVPHRRRRPVRLFFDFFIYFSYFYFRVLGNSQPSPEVPLLKLRPTEVFGQELKTVAVGCVRQKYSDKKVGQRSYPVVGEILDIA